MRAALRYDQMTGFMSVSRSSGVDNDFRVVPVDTLRRIGDADVDLFILEAMQYPGQTIRMPLIPTRHQFRRAA